MDGAVPSDAIGKRIIYHPISVLLPMVLIAIVIGLGLIGVVSAERAGDIVLFTIAGGSTLFILLYLFFVPRWRDYRETRTVVALLFVIALVLDYRSAVILGWLNNGHAQIVRFGVFSAIFITLWWLFSLMIVRQFEAVRERRAATAHAVRQTDTETLRD